MSQSRPDPRKRPPDPAGTQPKVDPESLRARAVDAHAASPETHPTQPEAHTTPSNARAEAQAASSEARLALPAPSSGGALTSSPADRGEHAQRLSPSAAASAAPPAALAAPVSAAPLAPSTDKPGSALASQAPHASPHAPRFQFLFGALGALSVAAVALAVVLLRSPAPAPERPWSAWKPVAGEVDEAQQIAAYVAPQYRLPGGKQIVEVTGGPPSLKGQPLTVGVIRSGQAPAALEGNNVLYQLCGDGADCSIKEGKPSAERGLLVAREALELALYTFRYVSGVDRVLVTIPPPPPTSATKTSGSSGALTSATSAGSQTTSASTTGSAASRVVRHAIIFNRQDLAPELGQPLGATLSAVTPAVSQMADWPDATAVKTLTEPHLYDFTISETQQGLVMLLETPGLGG
jgi:hypothetical protein